MSRVLKSRSHCVYSLHAHIVFVTKYRKKVINKEILAELKSIFTRLCSANQCELFEFNGQEDHVHLLIFYPPTLTLSKLINNLKAVSSRLIREKFADHVNNYYWKPVFWTKAYCAISAGGAPLDILKKYIEEQQEIEET